ncbi:MAG: hypothetical protein RLZZ221_1261 [Verrucomicrobiota bacterium]|jgi:hypothetical protein
MSQGKVILALLTLTSLFVSGCANLDLDRQVEMNRTISGTLNIGQSFPAGSEVMVRAFEMPGAARPASPVAPVERASGVFTENFLGDFVVTLAAPAPDGLPFRISLPADEARLQRGIMLEGRVVYGGALRFRTVNAHVVTARSLASPQRVVLQPAGP